MTIAKKLFKLVFRPEKREFIINHVFDLDVYKIYMMYFVWKFYSSTKVRYRFTNRTKSVRLNKHVSANEVRRQIAHLKTLLCDWKNDIEKLKQKMEQSGFILDSNFYSFLYDTKSYIPQAKITVREKSDGQLSILISGSWLSTILYETWILCIVNELYFQAKLQSVWSRLIHYGWGFIKLAFKVVVLHLFPAIKIALFGTRRRLNYNWEDFVTWFMVTYIRPSQLMGVSNVHFGIKYDAPLKGTSAHEMYMVLAAIASVIGKEAMLQVYPDFLHTWNDLFNGKLNVALTDTFTSEYFFQMLRRNPELISKYNVLRQDSGSPEGFTIMALKFYHDLNIDPKTKTILYSDGLNIWAIIKLWWKFHKQINVAFGWGTNLTNDVGFKTLSLVVKIDAVFINGVWVFAIKLSDNPSKGTGNEEKKEEYVAVFNPGFFDQKKITCKY